MALLPTWRPAERRDRSGRVGGLEGAPAVRPDGVLALVRVTVGLVATCVHDLQVVDVAVGLVEVAVAVPVVAVPDVVLRERRLDLLGRLASRQLLVVPGRSCRHG